MELTLRPYQVEAVDRIVERRSLLLALTMGAGKTAAAVSAVRHLRRQRIVDKGVVFALKSTKWQWVREIANGTPEPRCRWSMATEASRTAAIRRAGRYDYTILHYECLVNDWDVIKKHLPIDFMILDEVTYIKGFRPSVTAAKALAQYAGSVSALSGQPVENRPEELFSIMEFIDPEVLGGFHKFDRTFIERDRWGKPKRYKNLHLIQQALGPAMYRKSREDIAEWLPELIEIPMPVALDPATMDLHDLIRHGPRRRHRQGPRPRVHRRQLRHPRPLRTDTDRQGRLAMGDVMSRMLAMRMLSSHPALLNVSAQMTSIARYRGGAASTPANSRPVASRQPAHHPRPSSTPCWSMIDEILDEDPRHKVVVFTYFKPMLRDDRTDGS